MILEKQIRDKTRDIADLQQRFIVYSNTRLYLRIFRVHDLSQVNERLRLQLTEKEGTITTLARTNQIQQKAPVSLMFDDTL